MQTLLGVSAKIQAARQQGQVSQCDTFATKNL